MFTLADLSRFRAWLEANMQPGVQRASMISFLEHAGDLLTDARRDFAAASAAGQIQRLVPPTREAMAQVAADDAAALLEAFGAEPPASRRLLLDLASWSVSLIQAGAPRATYIQLLQQVAVLEDKVRTRLVAASVQAQQSRAAPPGRRQMVMDAIADANAVASALSGLAAPGKDPKLGAVSG